jgi:hypothetical protein
MQSSFEKTLDTLLTAEAQRTQRRNGIVLQLCDLCASAVKHAIKL